jgi:hypothetical protein
MVVFLQTAMVATTKQTRPSSSPEKKKALVVGPLYGAEETLS